MLCKDNCVKAIAGGKAVEGQPLLHTCRHYCNVNGLCYLCLQPDHQNMEMTKLYRHVQAPCAALAHSMQAVACATSQQCHLCKALVTQQSTQQSTPSSGEKIGLHKKHKLYRIAALQMRWAGPGHSTGSLGPVVQP